MADCYVLKQAGGVMTPADDETADYLTSIKTDSHLKVKITKVRNYRFHKKVFNFFNFCFAHWNADFHHEFKDERAQFNAFRKQLTILAGYHNEIVNLRTKSVGYEAQSLSYESMDEDTFRQCYTALINAAMKHIFKGSDNEIYNKLVSFF
jgi:hypothetical protein